MHLPGVTDCVKLDGFRVLKVPQPDYSTLSAAIPAPRWAVWSLPPADVKQVIVADQIMTLQTTNIIRLTATVFISSFLFYEYYLQTGYFLRRTPKITVCNCFVGAAVGKEPLHLV